MILLFCCVSFVLLPAPGICKAGIIIEKVSEFGG